MNKKMNNIPEEILWLRFKSLYRTLDNTEARELENWIAKNSEENSKELSDLTDLLKGYLSADAYNHIDMETAWLKIRNKTLITKKASKKYLRLSKIGAAAAIVIAALAVSLYLFIDSPTPNTFAQIKPGSPKATLELSNGEKIFLTDASDFTVRNNEGLVLGTNKSNHFIFGPIPKYNRTTTSDESEKIDESYREVRAITVPYGGEYTIQLYDKSIVRLNSGSTLRLPLEPNTKVRRVELEGEAYFEVTKDEHKPFEVATKNAVVRVLGTKFNVCSYGNDPKEQVTLVEGRVEVKNAKHSYILAPGEHYESDVKVDNSKVFSVNVNLFVSWKDGIYRFQNMRLAEIMPKFERWYNVKFEFKDKECADLRFTGATERQTNFEEFVKLIESTSGVKFTLTDNRIIISKK